MEVKEATQKDIPKILRLAEEYSRLPSISNPTRFDKVYFADYLVTCMIVPEYRDSHLIIVSESGFFIGSLNTMPWSPELIAFDHVLYTSPKGRGKQGINLIKYYENWAKSKGAKFVSLGLASGLDEERTSRYYKIRGYKQNSIGFVKEIK